MVQVKDSRATLRDSACLGTDLPNHQTDCSHTYQGPNVVAESIARRPRMREMWSLVPGAMTYHIDSCLFLAWGSALIG